MKKTLVAIAALASVTAFAQSTVTIDGGLDAGYQQIKYKNATGSTSGIGGNGSSTTQINFRGSSDLGGGLKATFRLETDFSAVSGKANTGFVNGITTVGTTPAAGATSVSTASANSGGGTFGNGEVRVGLESATMGQIHLGAVNNETLGTMGAGQPFGTAIGGGFRGILRTDAGTMGSSAVRADQTVKFVSPTVNGLTGTYVQVFKSSRAAAGAAPTTFTTSQAFDYTTTFNGYDFAGVKEVTVAYANGPLNARITSQKTDSTGIDTLLAASLTTRDLNTIGANYTIGNTVGYFLSQTYKTSSATANGNKVSQLSVKHTMGNHVVMATMGNLTNEAAFSATANYGKSSLTGLGYDYNLSKTTALYARYDSITDKAGVLTLAHTVDGTASGQVNGDKRTRAALGLRTTF
jgi:predicted porin